MGSCSYQPDILDDVVSTMLSQNATSANSTRAFANLKKAFPTWDKVVKPNASTKLEEAIHCGGLAKSRRNES
jgi:endonuclease-3